MAISLPRRRCRRRAVRRGWSRPRGRRSPGRRARGAQALRRGGGRARAAQAFRQSAISEVIGLSPSLGFSRLRLNERRGGEAERSPPGTRATRERSEGAGRPLTVPRALSGHGGKGREPWDEGEMVISVRVGIAERQSLMRCGLQPQSPRPFHCRQAGARLCLQG